MVVTFHGSHAVGSDRDPLIGCCPLRSACDCVPAGRTRGRARARYDSRHGAHLRERVHLDLTRCRPASGGHMVGDRCGAVGESQRQDAGGDDVEHFFHVFVLCEITYDGMSKVELVTHLIVHADN